MKKYILINLVAVFLFYSCDKVEMPYKEVLEGEQVITDKTRKILIEDYTGHTCGNCPSAALIAKDLKNTYGDQIIVMGVHAGYFAKPKSGPEYITDFRNPDGDEYDITFGNSIAGNPNGLVSRKKLNGSIIIQPASWETVIVETKDLEAELSLSITSTFNATSNSIAAEVHCDFYNTLDDSYNLVVSFVEDSIVDWQKDYTLPTGQQDIENYVHRHVFRGNLNGTWGDPIDPTIAVKENKHTFSFSYSPNINWVISKSNLVAYVYNTSTYEIIQVTESPVEGE